MDRILRQQKDARAATENARLAREKEAKEQEELDKSQPLPPGGFHEPATSDVIPEPIQQHAPPPPEKDRSPLQNAVTTNPTSDTDVSTNPLNNIKRHWEKIVQRNVKPHLPTPSTTGERPHSSGEAGPGVTPLSSICLSLSTMLRRSSLTDPTP